MKQVGVVDSGGQGLVFIYEGFLEGLLGENFADQYQPDENEMDEMINAMHHQSSVQSQLATQDIKNGYCTEIMVDLNADVPNKKEFDLEEFRKHLSGLGDSLLQFQMVKLLRFTFTQNIQVMFSNMVVNLVN